MRFRLSVRARCCDAAMLRCTRVSQPRRGRFASAHPHLAPRSSRRVGRRSGVTVTGGQLQTHLREGRSRLPVLAAGQSSGDTGAYCKVAVCLCVRRASRTDAQTQIETKQGIPVRTDCASCIARRAETEDCQARRGVRSVGCGGWVAPSTPSESSQASLIQVVPWEHHRHTMVSFDPSIEARQGQVMCSPTRRRRTK